MSFEFFTSEAENTLIGKFEVVVINCLNTTGFLMLCWLF
jgi:hypothetical protein